jgi:hypothetical protein
MTIAYMIVKRGKRPVKHWKGYEPQLPIYWKRSDALFDAEAIRGAMVIRVRVEETMLSYSYLRRSKKPEAKSIQIQPDWPVTKLRKR